jgi:hypothetical protein
VQGRRVVRDAGPSHGYPPRAYHSAVPTVGRPLLRAKKEGKKEGDYQDFRPRKVMKGDGAFLSLRAVGPECVLVA